MAEPVAEFGYLLRDVAHEYGALLVSLNLRCDNTFVEDARWHEQEARYSALVQQAADKRLLLLEFGVGFNTPVIIRMPFERMAAQLLDTTLVRFNRDYPQPYQAGIERFFPFTEDINRIISQLNIST